MPRPRRLRVLVLLGTALLVATCVPGAAAQPGSASDLAAIAAQQAAATGPGCDGTQGTPYATGLPAIPYCYFSPGGPNRYQDYGGVIKTTTTDAAAPKVQLSFPPLVLRTFFVACFSTAFPPPCPVKIDFPKYDASITPYYVGLSTDAWIQSTPGADPQYGDFPPVTVTTLAFGAIPVTATITVRQVRQSDGNPQPLHLDWIVSGPVQPGKVPPGYEKQFPKGAPTYGDASAFFTPAPLIQGRVTITVSDVKVDQVPLDVGTTCHTTTDLDLTAAAGFYNSVKPPKENSPGEFLPVNNTFPDADQFLHGVLDIPAFSGCTDGTQDVSNLITGTVSGQRNPVRVVLDGALKSFGCLGSTAPDCANQHPPYYQPPTGG